MPRVPRGAGEASEGRRGPQKRVIRASQECHEQESLAESPQRRNKNGTHNRKSFTDGHSHLISEPFVTVWSRYAASAPTGDIPTPSPTAELLVYPKFFPCSCYTAKSDGPPPPRISKTLLLRNVFALITQHAVYSVPLSGMLVLPMCHIQRKTRSVGV